jgi:hypothetical protein
MPVSTHAHALLAGCFAAMVLELAQVLDHRGQLRQFQLQLSPPNHDIEAVYLGLLEYSEGFVPMRFDELIRLKTALVLETSDTIGAMLWTRLHVTLQVLGLSKEAIGHFEGVLVAHGLAKYDQHVQFAVRLADYA